MASSGTERITAEAVDTRQNFPVPGDFGAAVSLVVTLAIGRVEAAKMDPVVSWALYDAIDGKRWWAVEDTNGEFVRHLHSKKGQHQTARFVVPVAPALRLSMWMSKDMLGGENPALIHDVDWHVFWRKF
jgi:hypothetical protein